MIAGVRPLTPEPGGEEEDAIRGPLFCSFFRAVENGDGWQMFVHVCVCMCVLELETRQSHRQ